MTRKHRSLQEKTKKRKKKAVLFLAKIYRFFKTVIKMIRVITLTDGWTITQLTKKSLARHTGYTVHLIMVGPSNTGFIGKHGIIVQAEIQVVKHS